MDIELIELPVDHKAAKRCSDYDEECIDVVSPSTCWCGNNELPPSDGYCPLMLSDKE